jgi:hypothetical protein
MGIMQDAAEKAFNSASIINAFKAPRVVLDRPAQFVFVAIDPNGGGDSRFAIVSAIYRKGEMVIVGLEAIRAHKPSQYESILLDHVKTLRKHRFMRKAAFVLMPEANLGFEAHHIDRCVNQTEIRDYSVTMRDDEQPGLRTTHAVKEVSMCLRGMSRTVGLTI